MFDVGVVGAILAVPPAIQAIRDLLTTKDPGVAHQVERSLKLAEESLITFSDIGALFLEAKSYHERLTQIDLAMSELLDAVRAPMKRGGFDHDLFNREEIVSRWFRLRDTKEFLPALSYFLTTVRKISNEPLKVSELDEPLGGELQYRLFITYRNSVDASIRSYDSAVPSCKEVICDRIDRLSHHVRHQILSADNMIIENATALGERLNELRKALTPI